MLALPVAEASSKKRDDNDTFTEGYPDLTLRLNPAPCSHKPEQKGFETRAVESGLKFEVIWFDQDVIEIVLSCSNGHFSGRAEIYLSHDDLVELADALRGFPSGVSDTRSAELGTFNPGHADGGVKMNLYCSDSSGHAVVESFVLQLMAMDSTIGASASLPMAT